MRNVYAKMELNVPTRMEHVSAVRDGKESFVTKGPARVIFGVQNVNILVSVIKKTPKCNKNLSICRSVVKNKYFRCHPWTGECECKAGWNSIDCSRPCPILTFGKSCHGLCKCENNAQCSPFNGTCICSPGYTGLNCEKNCPEGSFGEDCAQKCDCKLINLY